MQESPLTDSAFICTCKNKIYTFVHKKVQLRIIACMKFMDKNNATLLINSTFVTAVKVWIEICAAKCKENALHKKLQTNNARILIYFAFIWAVTNTIKVIWEKWM